MLHGEVRGGTAAGMLPLVLLHGFGGSAAAWRPLAAEMAGERRVIALDLPGHGGSLGTRAGGAGSMAKAVASSLQEQGIDRFHVAGHSMGGAVAALLALRQPERVASLTLLAPGGFGTAINGSALHRYASADDREAMADALRAMCGPGHEVSEDVISALLEARAPAGAAQALLAILDVILTDPGGGVQGVLPVEELGTLPMPVTVLWGEADPVLPVSQADGLPPNVEVQRLRGAGHMLIEKRPREVADAILATMARAS